MPFWDKSLDLVVLTHPHEDYATGLLEVMRRYKVGQVLERQQDYDTPVYATWRKLLDESSVPVLEAEEGQAIALKGGVNFEVLWPGNSLLRNTSSDANNDSVVLRLTYGDVSFLLAGDIQQEAESRILADTEILNSTVLKVAHQGSRTSSSLVFLNAVSPKAAVVLVYADNRYDHPHGEVVDKLTSMMPDNQLFMTKDKGDIQVTTDGSRLWVSTDR